MQEPAHGHAVDQLLDAALAWHRQGDLGKAEAGYRAVLRHDPDEPDALNLLGLILQERGDLNGSVSLIRHALDILPDFVEALVNLARVLTAAGDPTAAADAARQAIALDPDLAEAHLQLGHALIALGDDEGGVASWRQSTALQPPSPDTLRALDAALSRLSGHTAAWAAEATRSSDTELSLNALIRLGQTLTEGGRYGDALTAYRQADASAPGHPLVQHGLIRCIARKGDVAEAAAMCRRLLRTAPDSADLWLLLGYCEATQGAIDTAADAYRRALAIDPDTAGALHDLIAVGGQPEGDEATDAARRMLDDLSRPPRDRIAAAFALARANDRDGDEDRAFAAYVRANQLLKAEQGARGVRFDRKRLSDLVDWSIATFDTDLFAATAGIGNRSDLPVFIVGMPRSGTSLVEQIAASHPAVFGGGEQRDIFGILSALGGDRIARSPVEWDRFAVGCETTAHLRRQRALDGNALRITDKLPDNILCLGQIAVLLPSARIVVCRRDPRDVGLSCFLQYFAEDSMSWSNDLADCGFRARQIDRLTQHWREVLPSPILELDYETIVGDLEGESRRLIDFLGLDWDPACLTFHETVRTVRTASFQQVRQPIYTHSVGRWRRYRRHLGPLVDALGRSFGA